ncbi:aminotransferase class III-fold pyridoxal phosphate-dependent enzyme [Bifidobacterium tissieri]|uniref:Aminotransferase class III-fold pyridoxal phosphate-dependent enzyme n=1 Tax=Bifidobacterium tissieri TaxID=1630162 RepID=A0A5M9ZNF1_9BIFI|nr:aminotransferase class III-fold pyridoxal phosphate-dependent enzyme [Bifidobacterium tissieri]KAA8828372.1 aminotransferase class III-fold pyridoxal phosphate-dependent enzyme [Bifidobacterium tissieri]KAA8832398.1 aminotransferase class III-fold pyridoxal phosphate-dependent enzyme [Bifidobacterium tissieri]
MTLTGEEVAHLHEQYVLQPWAKQGAPATPIKRAEGIYFWDYDGNRYADMSSQMVCSNLGHQNKVVVEAIKRQADELCYIAPSFAVEPRGKLAKLLVDIAGADHFQRVFFTLGGSDSNENAIEIARFYTGRPKILSCYRSYHGSTLGSAFASGDWRRFAYEIGGAAPSFIHFLNPSVYEDGFDRTEEDEARCTRQYLRQLEEQIRYEGPETIAAVLMESIVGANGVLIPPKGYMEGVAKLCRDNGILLICDEVMAGFARSGKMFTWQNFDLVPDLITFAKGVTGATVPLGGVIASKEISAFFENHPLPCGLTYSGHPLACAAGVAATQYYLDNDICGHVKQLEGVLKPALEEFVQRHACVGEARCIGLFAALTLVVDKSTRELMAPYHTSNGRMSAIFAELKRRGFYTFGRESNLNVCPPLIITEDELREQLATLDDVLTWADRKFCNA